MLRVQAQNRETPAIDSGLPSAEVNRQKVNINLINPDAYSYRMRAAPAAVLLDGLLDEPAWQQADSIHNFYQNYPYDTGYAVNHTTVRLCSDSKFIYIGVVCYDSLPGNFIMQNLIRDWNHRDTDGFQVVFDPFSDRTNGFCFALSPYGAQREGIVINGGNEGVVTTWDNKWYSAAKRFPDRWTAEMAIPFTSLRFKEGKKEWRMNFARFDYKRNEMSTWVPLYRNFSVVNLAYTGRLVWEQPAAKTGANISIIPYLSSAFTQLPVPGGSGQLNANKQNAGLDAKVAVTGSLNLDLTINPDFSQVEVDQQAINLTRFELSYPERRNFFMENSDLFANFGSGRVRPFFSRRIGISQDPKSGLYTRDPVWFGGRLSGKLDRNWRIGAMDVITPNDSGKNLKGQNFTMLALQRVLFSRSNIGLFYTGRQALGSTDKFSLNPDNHDGNSTVGADFNLASADNRWTGKAFVHKTFGSSNTNSGLLAPENTAQFFDLEYTDRHYNFEFSEEYIGTRYKADVGYVPRLGYVRYEPIVNYTFLPKNSFIAGHGPGASMRSYFNLGKGLGDNEIGAGYSVGFTNTAYAGINYTESYTRLGAAFGISDKITLPAGGEYNYRNVYANFNSNLRKSLYFNAGMGGGTYYNARIANTDGTLNFRHVPHLLVSLGWSYTRLQWDSAGLTSNLVLIRPGISYSLRTNMFLRYVVQFNTQAKNVSSNLRFQWRFAPVSDFFLVYSDDYNSDGLAFKDRGLTAKLTYWFNL